jgi:vacuolar protein sorting-associated protein 54
MVSTPLRNRHDDLENGITENQPEKKPMAVVEGVSYRVVWSCLLLVEMIMTNLSSAAYFQTLAPNATTKIMELMRLFNTRTSSLVLGAGAIHSAARLKSINAKHLSYVTQCLGMITALIPHIRAALMAQLPAKQHTLLADIDKIKKEYQEHKENVLNKFVSIIGGIVEHGLAPRIVGTDFGDRARNKKSDKPDEVQCCVFLDGIANSTRKLHQVLNSLLPPDHLQDVFSRIFAYLDQKIPALFIEAASTSQEKGGANGSPGFTFPTSDEGKQQFLLEVEWITKSLNMLSGVHPWDFTATNVLERRLDYKLRDSATAANKEVAEVAAMDEETDENQHADNGVETATEEPATVEDKANASPNGAMTDIQSVNKVDVGQDNHALPANVEGEPDSETTVRAAAANCEEAATALLQPEDSTGTNGEAIIIDEEKKS